MWLSVFFIHPDNRELTAVDQMLTHIGKSIDRIHDPRSLQRFKQQFNQRVPS